MKNLLLIFSLLMFVSLHAQDIIEWRGDRTGVYNENNLQKSWATGGPKMLWHYDDLGQGHSSVSIANNNIYITGMTDSTGYLYVFDMEGKLINKKEYGTEWTRSFEGSRSTVIPNDGKLYLVSGVGNLYCFNPNTLDIEWQKKFPKDYGGENTQHGVNEASLIIGDKLIVSPGGEKYNIIALNKKDGSLIWASTGDGDMAGYCSPIYITDQEVPQIVTMMANHIIGVNAETGEKLWSYKNTNKFSEHPNTPVYSDGMLLCTSSYGKGSTMLRLINGGRNVEKVWESKELDTRTGHMLKIGNYTYGSGDKQNWYCVDWETGELKYKDNTLATGAIIANKDMLYCYSQKGEMALVKATPDKFDIVSQFSITLGTEQHWAHPVIHKGILYVRHGSSLMAYDIKE